jgi:hypothetical protein
VGKGGGARGREGRPVVLTPDLGALPAIWADRLGPTLLQMVASAVCTPVHASNGGAGVNEKGAVAGVLAAHGCPGAGRAGAHATPAASAAVLAMQTAAGASPCHAMAARATGMATAARTAVSVGFGGNKGIGLPVPVVARASIVSADDKDLAVNAVAVPLDA